jgi:hypothetical protein
MQRRVLIYLIASALLAATGRLGAQTPDDIDLSYAQTFVGMCVQSFPDIERVRAGAKALSWPEITDPHIRAMLAPKNPDTKWDAWSFSDGKNVFLATVSEVAIRGQSPVAFLVTEWIQQRYMRI